MPDDDASVVGPLDGMRVLDLSRLLPGDFCTLSLALLGADVIKVEDKGAGDYQRTFGHQVEGGGVAHHLVNRGKRSVCLDLKDDTDRTAFERLVRTSNVLVESFRPGVMARLGYGPEALHALRPDLVIVNISGFGATGPLATTAGHDINYLAFSGLLHRLGPAGGAPVIPPVAFADMVGGGLLPALLVLAAVRRAEASGIGCVIDASMTDAMALMPNMVIADVLAGADVPGRGELEMAGGLACYSVYDAADGHVAVGALEPQFWQVVCDVVGLEPELRTDHTEPGRQPELRSRLRAFFAPLTRAEVTARFAGRDACVSPVLSYEEMLTSEQATARGYLDPDGPLPVPTLAFPAMIDGRRLPERGPAPAQGEHTDEVLGELTTDAR